jgi:hypothetical protein
MATWSDNANRQMAGIKSSTRADSTQMGQLLAQISRWADANGSGRHQIDFGPFRNHFVTIKVENNVIEDVQYGDR